MKEIKKIVYHTPDIIIIELKNSTPMMATTQVDAIYNKDYNLHYGGIDEYGEEDPD